MGIFKNFYMTITGKLILADVGASALNSILTPRWFKLKSIEQKLVIEEIMKNSKVYEEYAENGLDIGHLIDDYEFFEMSSKEIEKAFGIKWPIKKRI